MDEENKAVLESNNEAMAVSAAAEATSISSDEVITRAVNNVVSRDLQCSNPATGEPWRTIDEVVPEITDSECEGLKYATGLSGNESDNCYDLQRMICDLKQEVDALNIKDSILIAANNESKCADDNLPTLASMWSRILRFAKAVTCILCGYDPRIATILKTGHFPQLLMGSQQQGGYPQWVAPDTIPTENSTKPVTSAGVYQAIQDTLMSAWHLWEQYPEFTYFAQVLSGTANGLEEQTAEYPPVNGDTALVAYNGTDYSVLYTFNGTEWEQTKVFEPGVANPEKLVNFAVTHIVKGYYADKGVYFFDDGEKGTWQVMDVDLTDLERQVNELQQTFDTLVSSADNKAYQIGTAATLEEAELAPCSTDKSTIMLITG